MTIKKILGSRTVFGIQIFTKNIYLFVCTQTQMMCEEATNIRTHTHTRARIK